MSKYNFQVQVHAVVTMYIQRECADEEAAKEMKEALEAEAEYFTLDDRIPHTDVDIEDVEVLAYGEQE